MGFSTHGFLSSLSQGYLQANKSMTCKNIDIQLILTYLGRKCSKIYNLLGPLPLGKLFLAAAVVALEPVSLEDILESAKCQDVESSPTPKNDADNTFSELSA